MLHRTFDPVATGRIPLGLQEDDPPVVLLISSSGSNDDEMIFLAITLRGPV
jgi:hypothetical protein